MSAAIGALRARVRIERPTATADAGPAWEEVDSVWAALAFSETSDSCRFELRMRRDVACGWSVVIGDRRFLINAMRDGDDRGARLLLECEEAAP